MKSSSVCLSFRFVQTKFSLVEALEREKPSLCAPEYLWGSKSLNSCYEAIFKLYHGFVGAPHFSSICRLLGYQGIYIIFTEIMKFCKSLVSQFPVLQGFWRCSTDILIEDFRSVSDKLHLQTLFGIARSLHCCELATGVASSGDVKSSTKYIEGRN